MLSALSQASSELRQYLLITANYWTFTLTDGALRMLVVLHFHRLGYQPLEIALLFLFYEFFGIVTNLIGGWLGARIGLNRTMNIGLGLQLLALSMLLVPSQMLSLIWVMAAQALSGIAKDLNKMSAKSAIKLLLPRDATHQLYRWVALLTGSKNTLKGLGFFVGGLLLGSVGFTSAVATLIAALSVAFILSLTLLKKDLGIASFKPKFRDILSKSQTINLLSTARLFLFGARDLWFVIALPVFLAAELQWSHWQTSSLLASWVIGYGLMQSLTPRLYRAEDKKAAGWAWLACAVAASMATALWLQLPTLPVLFVGLCIFGIVFAINSSLHSYLIVRHAKEDGVSLDIGFYYMANAAGRLIGTLLSGWLYQQWGLQACLWLSAVFLAVTALISRPLGATAAAHPKH